MKAHYLRNWEFETYLVPEEHIKEFDKLTEKIDAAEAYSTKWDKLMDEFNAKNYGEYKCEGELYSTKLFIEKQKI